MIRYFKHLVFCTLAIAAVFMFACKKTNNNPPAVNNNGNSNTSAPSITINRPGSDTSVVFNYAFAVVITAKATSTVNIDSIVGSDGIAHTFKRSFVKNGKSTVKDTLLVDSWTLNSSYPQGTVFSLVYKVYGNGQSNSITRKITVTGPPPTFAIYTGVGMYDQNQNGNYCFLNTGAILSQVLPYSQGQITNTPALRNLVDMCAAQTKGEPDIIFSPGYVNESINKSFADSNIYNINLGWTAAQRNTTIFKKLTAPMYVNKSNYPDYQHVKDAFNNAKGNGSARVQYDFAPGDNYAFKTADGRYGVFTLKSWGGTVVIDIAVESR